MILGFAHLTINTADLAEVEASLVASGYKCIAKHLGVANYSKKRAFCETFHSLHDLALLRAPDSWPLELTCHGPTFGENTQISWTRDRFIINVCKPDIVEKLFIEGLGFKSADDRDLVMASHFPDWSCRIRIEQGNSEPVRLDASGPTCLAFYCNHIDEELERLIELGAVDCTDIFEITLGEKKMDIAIMRLPGGPLLELINPRSINHD